MHEKIQFFFRNYTSEPSLKREEMKRKDVGVNREKEGVYGEEGDLRGAGMKVKIRVLRKRRSKGRE